MKKHIILLFVIIAVFVGIVYFTPKQRAVVYDCRLAEISPDYPPVVREECRRLILRQKYSQ